MGFDKPGKSPKTPNRPVSSSVCSKKDACSSQPVDENGRSSSGQTVLIDEALGNGEEHEAIQTAGVPFLEGLLL